MGRKVIAELDLATGELIPKKKSLFSRARKKAAGIVKKQMQLEKEAVKGATGKFKIAPQASILKSAYGYVTKPPKRRRRKKHRVTLEF